MGNYNFYYYYYGYYSYYIVRWRHDIYTIPQFEWSWTSPALGCHEKCCKFLIPSLIQGHSFPTKSIWQCIEILRGDTQVITHNLASCCPLWPAHELLPSTFWKESPMSATDAASVRRLVLWGPTDQCWWTLQTLRECSSHLFPAVLCHPAIKSSPINFTFCPFFSIEYQIWSCGLTSKLIPFCSLDSI